MTGSIIGSPWSKKAWCSSREVREEGYCKVSVILTEEDMACFCLSRSSWTVVAAIVGSSLSMYNTYMLKRLSIGNWSQMGVVEGTFEI